MVAVFAGVFLFFTKIRLPQILNQTFGSVGSMIGPASMMVTGMLIADDEPERYFYKWKSLFYYIFKADRSTGGGVAPFKGQWSCKWKS